MVRRHCEGNASVRSDFIDQAGALGKREADYYWTSPREPSSGAGGHNEAADGNPSRLSRRHGQTIRDRMGDRPARSGRDEITHPDGRPGRFMPGNEGRMGRMNGIRVEPRPVVKANQQAHMVACVADRSAIRFVSPTTLQPPHGGNTGQFGCVPDHRFNFGLGDIIPKSKQHNVNIRGHLCSFRSRASAFVLRASNRVFLYNLPRPIAMERRSWSRVTSECSS